MSSGILAAGGIAQSPQIRPLGGSIAPPLAQQPPGGRLGELQPSTPFSRIITVLGGAPGGASTFLSFPQALTSLIGALQLAPGSPPGPGGSGGAAPSAPGAGWEIYVYSYVDYATLLCQIRPGLYTTFQFVKQLNDIGSGSVTLNMDDTFWSSLLADGNTAQEILNFECLWRVTQNGVPRFEFLGETITEQLVDPSEARLVTITGPGTIATLKWAMAAPEGFPNIILKLDGIFDFFDEVDVNGNPEIDTNIWDVLSPAANFILTPISPLYSYPGGVGVSVNTLYPSGSLTLIASSGTTFLGATPYDGTDTLVSVQITPVGSEGNATDSNGNPIAYGTNLNGSELTQFYIQDINNPSYYAMIGLSSEYFYAQIGDTSGTFTKFLPAYDPNNHAYWMITEQGGSAGGNGTFYFWTAPDGETWTLQWQFVHDWDATYVGFYVAATYESGTATATITNLNSQVTTPSYQGNLYFGQPFMGIWYDLLLAAKARGTVPFVTTSLGPAVDSFGRLWTDSQNVQVTNGTDLYTLLQSGCAVADADFCMQPGFVLQVGLTEQGSVSLGIDRSQQIIMHEGSDFITKQRVRTRNAIQNLLGVENSDGHEISASAPSSITSWDQREGWFQTSAQVDPVSMAIAGEAAVTAVSAEILSYTGTITPNVTGRTIFQNFDVGDWLGWERPDFSAVDAVRILGIAVQVDAQGLETHELTVESYTQWLEEQLTYIQNKMGGAFVNIPGTTPVAPSSLGGGQVPTYFTPAATLGNLGDVVGTGAGHSSPLVYNPMTGLWQPAGTTDPATGSAIGVSVTGLAIAPDGGGAPVSTSPTTSLIPGVGVSVTNPITGASTTSGVQSDGSTTSVDFDGLAPLAPDTPTVVGGPGSVTVGWDGLLTSTSPKLDFRWTEVHISTTSGFTPSSATLQGTMLGGGTFVVGKLVAGTTYYAKLVARNTSGVASQASPQASAVPVGSGNAVTISNTAPVSPQVGDLWFNENNGYELEQWNGSSWSAYQYGTGSISAQSITATQIAANTITAAQIAAGTITATQIAANTITASQLAAGIVYAGIVNGTTIEAGTFIAYGTNGEIFIYSGTPATGNLVGSWAGSSGTDGNSNAFPVGFTVGLSSNTQVNIASNGGQGVVGFLLNSASFTNGEMASSIIGSFADIFLNGPKNNTSGHTDFVGVELNSSDGTNPANMTFIYNDPTGHADTWMTMGAAGISAYITGLTFNVNNSSFTNGGLSLSAGSFAQMILSGPVNNSHDDQIYFEYNSSDGSSAANLVIEYKDTSATSHGYFSVDNNGAHISGGTVAGVQAGTSPATPEAWHYVGTGGNPSFNTDWANHGSGYANLAFKICAETSMVWINGFAVPSSGATTTVFTLPSGYIPSSQQQYAISDSNTGVSGYVSVSTSGGVSVNMDGGLVTGHIYMLSGMFSLNI